MPYMIKKYIIISIQTVVQVCGRNSNEIFSITFVEIKVPALVLVEKFPDLDIYAKSGGKAK